MHARGKSLEGLLWRWSTALFKWRKRIAVLDHNRLKFYHANSNNTAGSHLDSIQVKVHTCYHDPLIGIDFGLPRCVTATLRRNATLLLFVL